MRPPPRRLTLDSPDKLQAFRDGLAQRRTAPRLRVSFVLDGVRSADQQAMAAQATALMHDTGWRIGVAGALLLMAASVAVYLWGPASNDLASSLWLGVALVLSLLVGATVGSFVGRMLAHRRLQRLCARLAGQLPPRRT